MLSPEPRSPSWSSVRIPAGDADPGNNPGGGAHGGARAAVARGAATGHPSNDIVPTDAPAADSRADVLLREALTIVAPLARMLITHGVTYPVFAQALKAVFLQAARVELERDQRRMTDSALSLLSGVHRKDVRAYAAGSEAWAGGLSPTRRRSLSMAAQVFARWIRDPAFGGPDGRPLALPVRAAGDGTPPSFESLAQSVSKDFHARSVLDELVRLRLVEVDGDVVRPCADQFTPASGFAELAFYFGANVRDHLAAGAANLQAVHDGKAPPFLEHALFADGLSAESVAELQQLARTLWNQSLRQIYEAARACVERDRGVEPAAAQRLRAGTFFFAEAAPEATTAPAADTGSGGSASGEQRE